MQDGNGASTGPLSSPFDVGERGWIGQRVIRMFKGIGDQVQPLEAAVRTVKNLCAATPEKELWIGSFGLRASWVLPGKKQFLSRSRCSRRGGYLAYGVSVRQASVDTAKYSLGLKRE